MTSGNVVTIPEEFSVFAYPSRSNGLSYPPIDNPERSGMWDILDTTKAFEFRLRYAALKDISFDDTTSDRELNELRRLSHDYFRALEADTSRVVQICGEPSVIQALEHFASDRESLWEDFHFQLWTRTIDTIEIYRVVTHDVDLELVAYSAWYGVYSLAEALLEDRSNRKIIRGEISKQDLIFFSGVDFSLVPRPNTITNIVQY